jgi:GT2 family glycosyltransferase
LSETSVPSVAVAVINYNGAEYLKACIESLRGQDHPPAEAVVLDNRSTDGSVTLLREIFPEIRLIELPSNLGYADAANLAIRETDSRYLLLVNPDVVLTPNYLRELLYAAERRPDTGSLTGKLLRFPEGADVNVIDSTGHIMFRNRWASNRGTGEEDLGQYEESREVFGVSGAAALYRREMLEDIRGGAESSRRASSSTSRTWTWTGVLGSGDGGLTTCRRPSRTTSGASGGWAWDAIPLAVPSWHAPAAA